MPIAITAQVSRDRTVACSVDRAFAFICDVPASARLFPLLAELGRAPHLDEGADLAWRSVLKPQGPPPFAVEPVYVCRYHVDGGSRRLTWTPVEGAGNTLVAGRCQVEEAPAGARMSLALSMETQVAAPRLARRVVQAAVQVGFEAAVAAYVGRIQRHLERSA